MAKFKIHHITRYTYEVPVRDSANQIMLYPIDDAHQEVILHRLTVTGNPVIEEHRDVFLNRIGTFTHAKPHQELVIDSRLEVNTTPHAMPDDATPAPAQWKSLEEVRFKIPFVDFMRDEAFGYVAEARAVLHQIPAQATPLQAANFLCEYVYKHFTYQKGITTVETTLDEIWTIKSGVCQDFAHILLALLRLRGIPARYVSGYICPNKNGMRGEGATHAWVEAYIPFYGWLGLDPTNNCIAHENHVRLAVGKNFADCSPVRGTYRGTSQHTLEVVVTVSYENDVEVSDTAALPASMPYVRNSYHHHQQMQQQQQ